LKGKKSKKWGKKQTQIIDMNSQKDQEDFKNLEKEDDNDSVAESIKENNAKNKAMTPLRNLKPVGKSGVFKFKMTE
jgi:hypothetical protein